MKLLNTLWIFLALGLGVRLSAMDEHDRYAFRCKIPVEREERSLPAGSAVSAVAVAPQVDSKVRAKKLAELRQASFLFARYNGDLLDQPSKDTWEVQKKLMKEAIEKYGIHPDEMLFYYGTDFWDQDSRFVAYLIRKGIDINCIHPAESHRDSLPLAKLMILKGAKMEKALFEFCARAAHVKEPKLALLYYKYGANPAVCSGYDGKSALIAEIDRHNASPQLVKYLVALGVPLDTRNRAGCDYGEVLARNFWPSDSDKKELREAIDEAIQKNTNARSQGLPVIAKELAHHFRSGPREIEDLVIAYLGHIVPDDILREIEAADAEADQGLAQLLRADKGDEKSN